MARAKRTGRQVIATYSDSWFELTYRTFAGVIDALPQRSPPVLVDHGPLPLAPETSADAPPWRGRADGALVYGSTTGDVAAFAAWLRRGEVPTVGMLSEFIDSGIPTVCVDYRELGRIAAEHLAIDCGCRSFLHVGTAARMSTIRREEGFRDALAALGHESHACRVEWVSLSEERTFRPLDDPRFDALLRSLPRPIGLFAQVDKLAAAAVARCDRLGLRVPQDVAVLGVDNTMLSHTHTPSLSSIRVCQTEVGAAALRLLTGLMRGDEDPRQPTLIGGSEIYPRMSTVGTRERRPVLIVDVAMEQIKKTACTGLTVERLAETLDVSRRRLEELFRSERGCSPNEEIQRVRFETAAMLLRFTTHSVTKIAQTTGFTSPPAFFKFFQRMIGMTPLEHRSGVAARPRRRPLRRRRGSGL